MIAENVNKEIFELKRKIIDNKYAILQNKMGLEKYERTLMGEIANAVGEDKKPLFSNMEKRQAEFERRSAEDKDYIVLKEYIQKLERDKDEMYAELEFKQNVFLIEIERIRLGMEGKQWYMKLFLEVEELPVVFVIK